MNINLIWGLVLIVMLIGFVWFLVKVANAQAPKGKKGKDEVKEMLSKIKTH